MKDKKKSDNKNLKKEFDDLKNKADEFLNGWKRAKADYLNFKKETEKRQKEVIEFANASLVAQIIPIYNNFKLAVNHIPVKEQNKDWVVGFIHIKKQMGDFLNGLGIIEIKTIGEKFNPEIHEAVSHEKKEGVEADIVIEEVTSGYTLHDKVLNPAKVKVSK